MYFSNIANEELQYFHNTIGVDFSLSLTDILESDLFEVEEIITDTLYRVFPLFYCKEIISSNPNDRNLENRCLICNKTDTETYYSFRTNGLNDNLIINEEFLSIQTIGGHLSANQFNGLVYMLREQGQLTGNINFEETDAITGTYGTYKISDNNQLRNDTGYIVNEKIKNNPLTIKLTNPFFLNANYTLTFTVTSITGANVCESETEDYIVKDSFDVVLVKDSEVAIDLTSYTNDSVLSFDVDVNISFDVPEIINSDFSLELEASDEFIPLNEDVTLTATLTGESAAGYSVNFFEDGLLIGTETTNSNGVAILTDYPCGSAGNHIYSCQTLGLTANVNVLVGKYNTSMTIASDKSIAYIPTTFTVTGVLEVEGIPLEDATVKLYNNNNLFDELTTDENGEWSKEITVDNIATYNLQAVYEGSIQNKECSSTIVNVTARKLNTNITINTNKSSMYYSESVTVTGKLTDELGSNVAGATVSLMQGNTQIATATTNNNGEYTFNKQYTTIGTYLLSVEYSGDSTHNNKTSTSKQLTVNKAPVTLTINAPNEYYKAGDTITIQASSSYGSFLPSAIIVNFNGTNTELNNPTNGIFTYTIPNTVVNTTSTLTAKYNGNNSYASSTSSKNITTKVLNSITLSKSNNNLILNFKDLNNNNLANWTLNDDVILTFVNAMTQGLILSKGSLTTNSNGNLTITNPVYLNTGSTITATFGNLNSNTLTW